MTPSKKIVLVCTGLGRVNRGFEQYIAGLAKQLSHQPQRQTQIEVWTGGLWKMDGVKSRQIANMHRKHVLLAKSTSGFLWEQRSFFLGMIPALLRTKPTAIYLGEYQLYCYLFKLRSVLKLNYALVLYTGGQALPGLFNPNLDFVHHVTNAYLAECKHIGASRQWLLPHFINQDFVYDANETARIKALAAGKRIVLSVGLLDKQTKQMHLLIEAVNKLPEPVMLILLGEESAETDALRTLLLQSKINADTEMLQVPHTQLGNWYLAADLFVLCSPKESFGLAMVEAMYHGLPVICRPFTESEFVLQQEAHFESMNSAEDLAIAIKNELELGIQEKARKRRIEFIKERYSWQSIGLQYINMMNAIANQTLPVY